MSIFLALMEGCIFRISLLLFKKREVVPK